MKEYNSRKSLRLKEYDYNSAGYYFITICTLNRQCNLGQIVLGDPQKAPITTLSDCGIIADKYLKSIESHNEHVQLDKYIIMPNHIHAILIISADDQVERVDLCKNILSKIIHGFKRLTNKEIGKNIWQSSFYDHIIRNEQDYLRIWEYIDMNPIKWADDEYYI